MKISTEIRNNRFYAVTPFNREFVSEAKMLGGKFDADEKSWHFDPRDEQAVRSLLIEIFGTDGSVCELCDVEVTVLRRLSERHEPIILAGREIARAFGRDSGAKPGEGVVFTTRKPQSGGSVKNWETVIEEGAVFQIRDLPVGALTQMESYDDISFVRVGDDSTAKAELENLIAERDRINARIAEIEANANQ